MTRPPLAPEQRSFTHPVCVERRGSRLMSSLNDDAPNSTGTEGQVGHRDGERTGGREPRLGRDRVARARGTGTAATVQDLQGVEGRGPGCGQESAEDDAAELVEHAGQRAAGDAAQRWSWDRWGGRAGRVDLPRPA